MIRVVEWDPSLPAQRANDHILFSRSTSNAHVVTTDEGDVIINTGMSYQGARHRERFEQLLGRSLDVRKIILTQSHPDHMGGWQFFSGDGVETIVARAFPEIQRERTLLNAYFGPRGKRIVGGLLPKPEHASAWQPEANAEAFEAATRIIDEHEFVLGGRRFEVHATPSGETLDSVVVWMPDERTLFTGNLLGALYGALPHFHTPRGDRDRSIPQFLRDIGKLIDFAPKMLITGHEEPIVGEGRILADLTRLRDAVKYIHDQTVAGMNAGKDMFTLMREIALPDHLRTAPGRGPVRWYVRSVWEEYTGWFRQDLTSELYPVPPSAIWPDLCRMAGGANVLAETAQHRLAEGKPMEALHFIEMAIASEPANAAVRDVEIMILETLIDLTAGEPHDELTWLESKIADAQLVIR